MTTTARPLALLTIVALLAACGPGCGGSAPPPASTTTASDAPRPVRIPSTETSTGDDAPRPVRVEPALPGEAPLSSDLADPPPVEPPPP